MYKTMTNLGLLAMTASLALAPHPTGVYATFKLDGVSNYSFAYIGAEGYEPALLLLTGDLKQGFDIVGVAEVFGPVMKFAMAEIDRSGVVTKIDTADNYISLHGRDLTLNLGEILAQMTVMGFGKTKQMTALVDQRTKFVEDKTSSDTVTSFVFAGKTYIAFQKSGSDKVIVQHVVRDEDYLLAKSPVGVYDLAKLRESVVDPTATANTAARPVATAARVSTDTDHGEAKQAVAAA